MTTGIYKITESASGLCYIGQSINIERRWKEQGKRFSPDAYDYEVLIVCPIESLNFFEKSFISGYDSHRNGFNGTVGGTNVKSTHPSDATRAKLSAANKGRTFTDEARAKISAANKGRTFTDDQRAKMSESAKIKTFTDEHRAAIGAGQLGRTRSDETRELISASKRGKPRDEATRLRISETLRNKRNGAH